MNDNIKPIETKYKGYLFRSRTEARWAVFFDTIGFRWQYEEEGYKLANGRWYLPDFKLILPSEDIFYIEVKPEEFDSLGDSQIIDYRFFSKEIGFPLVILTGQPNYQAYNMVRPEFEIPEEGEIFSSFSLCFFQDYHPYIKIVDEYFRGLIRMDQSTGHKYFDVDDREARKNFGERYLEAIQMAKASRF